jgi:MATE family multidrug resistance protein
VKQPSLLRKLLSLSWPIVLARATQSVVGFCDALMVAPLGEEPLAAATTGALNTLAIIILPMGTVFIVQSFAAQLRGRGELSAIRRYAWYGIWIAFASGLLTMALLPLVPVVLGWFDYSPAVHDQMSTYLRIRLWSVFPVVATEALGNWYGGLGNTRVAMAAGILTMVANVLGNYALIEPHFGLPGYGIAGAAWASVGSSWLGFGLVAALFAVGWGAPAATASSRLKWSELVRVLRFGLPNGMNWFLEFAAFTLFVNGVVAHLGTTVLAALNVVMQINTISFMPAFGVSSAGAILVGEAIGRHAKDEVPRIVRLTAGVAMAWMTSIGLLYLVFPAPLMGLFEPRDVKAGVLLATGATMLRLASVWQLFDAAAMALSEALRAAGDTAWCMIMRIVLAWGVFTPVAWAAVFVFGGGVLTVMIALIGYICLLAVAFYLRFASGRWRQIELIDAEPKLV